MASPHAMYADGSFGMVEDPWLAAGQWDQEALSPSAVESVHAANASFYADTAAKHAASLAQWVQYLSGTLNNLQNKVSELEDWKKQALEETRRLREEHKALKRQVLEGERASSEEASPVRLSSAEDDSFRGASVTSSPPFGFDNSPPRDVTPQGRKLGVGKTGTFESMSTSTPSGPWPLSPGPVSPSARFGDLDAPSKEEGLRVTSDSSSGAEQWRVEWRVANLSAKLKGCMGRALVSSPFTALGFEDLRLMICPDGKDAAAAQGQRNRKHKELYTKKITEGPLDGSLKLKIPSCPKGCELEFSLSVGSLRRGPFRHNFAESTVSECGDFGDWLLQLEADRSLTVAVDLKRPAPSVGEDSTAA